MPLTLNTEEEHIHIDGQKIPAYREFFGPYTQQMPLLLQSGREAMSVADVLKRRYAVQNAPEQVKTSWHDHYLFTHVGNHQFRDGSAKFVLHDPYLRKLDIHTPLSNGAARLSDEQWESLTGKNVFYLSPERVKAIHGKTYTKEIILDSPEWNFLFEQHATLREVTGYLFDEMNQRFDYREAMGIEFDDTPNAHTNKPAYAVGLGGRSRLCGRHDLDCGPCRLVGFLAPEALTHQAKLLEEKLQLPFHKNTP